MHTLTKIGRNPDSNIVIADPSVSREHAVVFITDNGNIFVTDCFSSNGTFVMHDGTPKRVRQDFVKRTDTLMFGDVVITVDDILVKAGIKQNYPQQQNQKRKQHTQSWVQGTRLVRCSCGAVKQKNDVCPECGS